MKILVAYGTKKGSTAEVAEQIALILREQGMEVDLMPAAQVKEPGAYAAIVLGGSIYMGRLHPDVMALMRKRRGELTQLPVALFAMGPKTTSEKDIAGARGQLDSNLKKVPELEPVSIAIFGGVIDPSKLRFPFNRMPASDARDWDAIRAWAKSLPAALGQVGLARVGD